MALRRLSDRTCPGCGTTFRPKYSTRKFCSNDCYLARRADFTPAPCSVEGCERGSRCLGFCSMHYNRLATTGDVGPAEKMSRCGAGNSNWKGGRGKGGEGGKYVLIHAPDHPAASKQGRVLEHRLVMEKALGRYLADDEIVHHVNGDTTDNRAENLEVMTQAEHARLHKLEVAPCR